MKKMASILLIVFFALAVIGRLSSFFDRVQYQGISQDPSYRSLQVEQKLTPEQLEEYGVLLDEQQQEQYDVYLICAEVENTTARNDYSTRIMTFAASVESMTTSCWKTVS